MKLLLLNLIAAVCVSAHPAAATGSTSCTVKSYADFSTCVASKSATILIKGPFTVPAEKVVDLTKLQANTHVILSGKVKFAKSSKLDGDGPALMSVGGAGITFESDATNPGILDGTGELYWDGKGGNGGVPKPKMFRTSTTGNSVFKGFTILNAPVHIFSIGGSDTTFDGIKIDNSLGDTKGGHNTDGFDVSGNGITIQNSSEGGIVENVLVKDCVVKQSTNAIRIKTLYQEKTGHVSNIAYNNVQFDGITKVGVSIQQDYLNGGPTGKADSKMPITGVTFTNVGGNMASGSKAKAVYLLCGAGMCTDIHFTGLKIKAASNNLKSTCSGITPVPSGAGCNQLGTV
ncbi:hypothetical protein HDU81_002716 [Chytriomyces hyalinus]|nr:hypothetical protein HDU81_002716 [Chytriomyces hyalinus]